MKKADLIFKDVNANGYSSIYETLFERKWGTDAEADAKADAWNKHINSLIRKAKDTDDFVETYLADSAYKGTQCYEKMLKVYHPEKVWYYIREMFGDKCQKTWSDAGSLKIGNDDFTLYISNGYGDGEMRYAVLNEDEFYAQSIMEYQCSVNGKFNVYCYDCGTAVDTTLEGRFGIFSYDRLVALVRWK